MDTETKLTDRNSTTQESLKRIQLSEAVLLAVVSAVAYLFAFLYERGYTSYFGIPTQFVNVSLITLLIFGAGVFTFLYSSATLVDMFFSFIPKHPYLAFYVPRLALILFLFALLPFFILEGQMGWIFTITLGSWFLWALLIFVVPLIQYRKKGNWDKRYDAALERETKQSPIGPGLYSLIASRYGIKNLGLLIFLIFYFSMMVSLWGEAEGMKQKDFLVINTTPEMVVLRAYGENMICAPFDRNTQEVKKSFSIIKMAVDPKLVMNLETVGPLKPVEKLTSEKAAPLPTPTPEVKQ